MRNDCGNLGDGNGAARFKKDSIWIVSWMKLKKLDVWSSWMRSRTRSLCGAACCLSLQVYINVRADRLAHTIPGYSTLVVLRRIVKVHSKMKMLKVVVFALFAFLLVAVRGSPLQHKLEDVTSKVLLKCTALWLCVFSYLDPIVSPRNSFEQII